MPENDTRHPLWRLVRPGIVIALVGLVVSMVYVRDLVWVVAFSLVFAALVLVWHTGGDSDG